MNHPLNTNQTNRTQPAQRHLLAALVVFSTIAHGQAVDTATARADATIQHFLDGEVAKDMARSHKAGSVPGRFEISVGQIDPRLQLAPCARIEPQLPANTRLWGRVNVMLRCVEGANWNVSLPVTVRIFGQALTTIRALSPNEAVQDADVELQEIELTRDPGVPVTSVQQIAQKVLSRPVAAGTALRQDWFRVLPVIVAGDMIKVIATGNGFSVTSDGQALNQANDGQTVRIKTESGRVITGTARSGRIAEIRL